MDGAQCGDKKYSEKGPRRLTRQRAGANEQHNISFGAPRELPGGILLSLK